MDAPHPSGTSDLIEEADAKSKTRERSGKPAPHKPSTSDFTRHSNQDTVRAISVPASILLNTSAPAAPNLLYPIGVIRLEPYLQALYMDLINLLAPGAADLPRICSEAQFVLVSQHIIKARCQHICRTFDLDYRIDTHLDCPTGIRVPTSFARVIHGLGRVTLMDNALTAYPVALIHRALTADELLRFPDPCSEPARQFNEQLPNFEETNVDEVPHDTFRAYVRFIDNIARKNVSLVTAINGSVEGTQWYTLGVLTPTTGMPANSSCRAYITSLDRDPNPMDSVIALTVQRGFDGIPPIPQYTFNFRSPIYDNLFSMMTSYNAST